VHIKFAIKCYVTINNTHLRHKNFFHPEGESIRVGFDGGIKLEFHCAKVTSNWGLHAYRVILITHWDYFIQYQWFFTDKRTGRNIQHAIPTLLRQSIYSCLADYKDVYEAERLSVDLLCERSQERRTTASKLPAVNMMGRIKASS